MSNNVVEDNLEERERERESVYNGPKFSEILSDSPINANPITLRSFFVSHCFTVWTYHQRPHHPSTRLADTGHPIFQFACLSLNMLSLIFQTYSYVNQFEKNQKKKIRRSLSNESDLEDIIDTKDLK